MTRQAIRVPTKRGRLPIVGLAGTRTIAGLSVKTPAMEPDLLNESWAFDHRVLEEEILVDFDADARLF